MVDHSVKYLKYILQKFWGYHRFIVSQNAKFKDMHKGETCLIFGNGGSLKYYDFTFIKKHPSIVASYSLVDKRMSAMEINYGITSDSYGLYPIRWNSKSTRVSPFSMNIVGKILKNLIKVNSKTHFFTSLTHYYAFLPRPSNLSYFHHFGEKTSNGYDLAGVFSNCSGALDIMISLAKYMGFSKAILLGCDYLGSPKLEGHFYSDSIPVYGNDDPQYVARIKDVAGELDVLVILPKGSSCSAFNSTTFEEHFGAPDVYKSNIEIVREEYLIDMRKASLKDQIYL